MRKWLERRYLEVVASIYIYNEHRGYTALDRVIDAVRRRDPGNKALIAMIEQHRADERKHYWMFRRWFEKRGIMPLQVDRTFGHIDRFVEIMFRTRIDALTEALMADRNFAKLCRVISLTEQRGYRQVETLLDHFMIKREPRLMQDLPRHQGGRAEPLGAIRCLAEGQRQARPGVVGARGRQLHPFRAAVREAAFAVPRAVGRSADRLGGRA